MAENEIRIKDLPSTQQINETDDVIVLDNATDGTRKLQGKLLLDMIHSAMAKGTASGAVATFTDGADGIPMTDLVVSIEPQQSGSGDPSPENIRPISGWTACNVVRCGENLFDKATITENKILDSTTGEEIASYGRFSSDYIKVDPSTDYYASNVIRGAQWYCVFYYDKNKNYLSCGELPSTGDNASGVVTTPSDCNYVRLVGVSTYKDDVSFVVGNQAPSSYSAYSGNTYTINFVDGSSPLTVYGGTLDVLSGVLTVDRIKTSMPAYWTVNTESSTYWLITNTRDDAISVENTDTSIRVISDGFKGISANEMITKIATTDNINSIALISSQRLFLKVSKADYPTLNDLYSMIQTNNLQVIYELATPQTYQLTPTQVKSLPGVNNIWADTGNIINAEYVRDTTTIINQILARLDALES